jgi:hypothetical protein
MLAEPEVTPATTPLTETVATPAFDVDHVIVWLVSVFPVASLAIALSCTVPPAGTVALAGVTATDATVVGVEVTVI